MQKTIKAIHIKCCLFLLIGFISCNEENSIISPFDGSYQGKVVKIRGNSVNGIVRHLDSDTMDVNLSIENFQFEKQNSGYYEFCSGIITLEKDKILFEADGCNCWCNCDPHVDCTGDIILGNYRYEITNDSLKMWIETERMDTSNFANINARFIYEEYYELKRK